jgi:NADH-quinone oxidoreductase subunit A
MILHDYVALAIVLLIGGAMAAAIALLGGALGPRKYTKIKASPFECGSEVLDSAKQRFSVKFYVVALLFIVFDLETVFLYPWAVNFRALGWFGYGEMVVFAFTLVVGLIYVWKKGALNWD